MSLKNLINELEELVKSLENFDQEKKELTEIKDQLNNFSTEEASFEGQENEMKHQIWKHYRKYKFKEFIFKLYYNFL